MNDNKTIDQAAQDQESHDSMVESTVDRQTFDEITQQHRDITEGVRPSMKLALDIPGKLAPAIAEIIRCYDRDDDGLSDANIVTGGVFMVLPE